MSTVVRYEHEHATCMSGHEAIPRIAERNEGDKNRMLFGGWKSLGL
jgi:hypothetical protein